ncbi:hypothetical protein [Chromobacterium rhizoryzae]|uniref:hypothetical protein n=1 Tax=Chromobacterium rhizoryzae TaxID=1778675 RepID=UPI001D0911F0|nr:hypothetical protein [Chromobacterium rhizoryzae]
MRVRPSLPLLPPPKRLSPWAWAALLLLFCAAGAGLALWRWPADAPTNTLEFWFWTAAFGPLLWAFLLCLRGVAYYSADNDAAFFKDELAQRQQYWLAHHRQTASLAAWALLTPQARGAAEWAALCAAAAPPPPAPLRQQPPGWETAPGHAEIETRLANRLAQSLLTHPRCPAAPLALELYWQGTDAGRTRFIDALLAHWSGLNVDSLRRWESMQTLDTAIERLHTPTADGSAPAAVLCAGLALDPAQPARQAGFAWLLRRPSADDTVRFSRPEWSDGGEDVCDGATRNAEQAPAVCLGLDKLTPTAAPWPAPDKALRPWWNGPPELDGPALCTLAAIHAAAQRQPCGWLLQEQSVLYAGMALPTASLSNNKDKA